jgi:hypothetical protein
LEEDEDDDDDDDEDGGALYILDFGGERGREEASAEEGWSLGKSGGIYEAHLENLAFIVPDASPSSSSLIVGSLLTTLYNCSVFSANLFFHLCFCFLPLLL